MVKITGGQKCKTVQTVHTMHNKISSQCTSISLIAERLSLRLIIVQAQQALVGSFSEVVFVCLSVTGLRWKCMGLRIVHISCSMCPLFFMLALVMEDSSEDKQ